MTSELEPVGELTKQRRKVDETLARFSAAHEEAAELEQRRKERWTPWSKQDKSANKDESEADGGCAGLTRYTPSAASQLPGAAAEQPTSLHKPARQLDLPTQLAEPVSPEPATSDADETALASEPAEDEPTGEAPAEDAEDAEQLTRLQEKKARKRLRSAKATRITTMVAAILVFLATGTAWGVKAWVNGQFNWVAALDEDSDAIRNAAGQTGDENFLLVGSDTRAGAAQEENVGDEDSIGGARSDTVMIAHVPANRERVVVVSFPRDLEVQRPDCEQWDSKSGEYGDQAVPRADAVKLNTAYAVGGPRCVTKLVQEISGLKINHFVGVDFNGFKGMVDAMGGVEICSEEPVEDEVLGTVLPNAGVTRINGDTALNFVRARHVENDPTSDYGRINRQQLFLSALLRQAMSSQVLLDPGKLTGFVEAFSRATYGENIDVDQLLTLGQSLQGLEAGRVTFVTVPTIGEANDAGNEVLRDDDTHALFDAIIDNTPLPGEQQQQPDASAAPESVQGATNPQSVAEPRAQQPQDDARKIDPKTLRVEVLNGGNPTEGLASRTADALAEQGFQITGTANADGDVDRTLIRHAPDQLAAAHRLASSVPGAHLVEDPSLGKELVLVLGPEFSGQVADPNASEELPEDLSTVNATESGCG